MLNGTQTSVTDLVKIGLVKKQRINSLTRLVSKKSHFITIANATVRTMIYQNIYSKKLTLMCALANHVLSLGWQPLC